VKMKIHAVHNALLIIAGLLFFTACRQNTVQTPSNFPKIPFPEDNPITQAKVDLGRKLFYEKALSIDSSVSCGSCHIQKYAFADTATLSRGAHDSLGFRNSRALINPAYLIRFFGEGGVNSIERATIPPMQAEFEMNLNIAVLISRLKADAQYAKLFKKVFNSEPNHKNILQALSSFQRTLISGNSKYDSYLRGDSSALSEIEKRGLVLFKSEKLNCKTCHSGLFFTDENTYNIGLYSSNPDWGRGRLTLKAEDYGAFLTPTLRNISVTAPYMHDGSLKTLEEVIDFYATGGENHPAKADEIKPFELSEIEKEELILFLESLTDSTFINNSKFSDPN